MEKAVARALSQSGKTGAALCVTSDARKIASSSRVILPGVGAFGAVMAGLAAIDGALESLEHAVLVNERPFLGICVGMQLLADKSEEFGEHAGLGWIAGAVQPIERDAPQGVTIPHMGWNRVEPCMEHPLFEGISAAEFYFAHSFYFAAENDAHVLAKVCHGNDLTAAVIRDNIAGVQFHPEKSQRAGLALLENFLKWDPI